MPRSLVLGNGNLLVGYDNFAQVRDFYFPYVGLENQAGGRYKHRIGVFVDNSFSWIDDGIWEIHINYAFETLVSHVVATNDHLKIRLTFEDVVYNETDIFIRKVTVENLVDYEREIKIFFAQEFEIYESWRGDTCYYDPIHHVIIHYKGRRSLLINGQVGDKGFDEYCVGLFNIEGKEGTWKDAEDGKLEGNAIEHGMVDSVICFKLHLSGNQKEEVYYWIAAAKLIREAHALNDYVLQKSPQHLLKTTRDFWHAWVNTKPFTFHGLDQKVVELFKKSLLIIRTHADNRWAIVASGDSELLQFGRDAYSYTWPRDGALTALSIDRVEDNNVARRFFEFCNEVIEDEGYFMHKYRSDRSLGASWHAWMRDGKPVLPIQEDGTALVIYALWRHYEISTDLEYVESIYNSLIRKASQWMCNFRDETTGLPKPSYDLWEEKFGIHTFTVAAVYGALMAATKFAHLLGKSDEQEHYKSVANSLKEALLEHLYDQESGEFYKMIKWRDGKKEVDKTLDFSSIYGVFKFGVLDIDDQRLKKAMRLFEERLTVPGSIGGIVRYENDNYFRVNEKDLGNPWIITTLWRAQYYIAGSKSEADLKVVKEILDWVAKYARKSGVMSEQLNPHSGEQLSTAPLTWSHSEYVITIIEYMEKLEELGISPSSHPKEAVGLV
jgi:GH15 family glucan-1,4-alpha-glucosidase